MGPIKAVTVVRISISHRTKPMYAIRYPSGIMHGQYQDKSGSTRYAAWTRKRDATSFLARMIKDAGDLIKEMQQQA